jgi:taurine dioxygenase
MSLSIRPLTDSFGARIEGIDLSKPLDEVVQAEITAAFHRHSVLVFPGQTLTPDEHTAFSRGFGPLEIHVQTMFLLPGHPEIYVISNIVEDGRAIGAIDCALSWHSDSSYMAVPSLGSVLYGVEVPPVGADTWFAGMFAPYEALPEARRREIADLKAVHSYLRLQQKQFPDRPMTAKQREQAPDIAHPIVRTHPVTGRRSLFLGGAVIAGVEGMPADEGIGLVRELLDFATGDAFTYCHKWQAGDVVMWDNRCSLHKGTKYDVDRHRRRMHRTTLAGRPGAPAM